MEARATKWQKSFEYIVGNEISSIKNHGDVGFEHICPDYYVMKVMQGDRAGV